MGMLGVKENDPAMMMKWRKQKRNEDVSEMKKKEKKKMKVTYISSPMKVKTSASNFRALVQELTGQDSNVADKFLHHESADENDASMAGASISNNGDDERDDQHEVEEREGPSSSWLDLLTEDYSSGFQYSRSLFEPFNPQQYIKLDLVET